MKFTLKKTFKMNGKIRLELLWILLLKAENLIAFSLLFKILSALFENFLTVKSLYLFVAFANANTFYLFHAVPYRFI